MATDNAVMKKTHPLFAPPPKKPSTETVNDSTTRAVPPPPPSAESSRSGTPKNERDEDTEPTGRRHKRPRTLTTGEGGLARLGGANIPREEKEGENKDKDKSNTKTRTKTNGKSRGQQTLLGGPSQAFTLVSADVQQPSPAHDAVDLTIEDGLGSPDPLAQATESVLNRETLSSESATTSAPAAISTKPKTLLRFDPKTGTIGTPPKKAPEKPKSSKSSTKQQPGVSGLVTIRYGNDAQSRTRIGQDINKVLDNDGGDGSNDKANTTAKSRRPRKNSRKNISQPAMSLALRASPTKDTNEGSSKSPPSPSSSKQLQESKASPSTKLSLPSTKSTHPFFLAKPKETKPPAMNTAQKAGTIAPSSPSKTRKPGAKEFSSTPRSPKKPRVLPAAIKLPRFGGKTGGTKVPGAKEPAWPWKGMVHIRGGDQPHGLETLPERPTPVSCVSPDGRKAKSTVTNIPPTESVLQQLEADMDLSSLRQALVSVNGDDFPPPPPELRLPAKHFESGPRLQRRVLPHLRTFKPQPSDSDDELMMEDNNPSKKKTHAAISGLYGRLLTSLSAFDRAECEGSAWVQKYAPARAVDVLQVGREAILLKEWLEKHKIHSVDTGAVEDKPKRRGRSAKDPAAEKEKKKRKRNRLDDFIMETDEEEDGMDEISDPEDDWMGPTHGQLKTVIRNGDQAAKNKDGVKLTNAVVISGPHGCGKTAAVYAVAKELNYEVREIHAGIRRSGKDVSEMIEAMTQNHIVGKHISDHVVIDDDDEDPVENEDDQVAKDLKSGKQKTMASFFQPKPSTPAPKLASAPPSKPAKSTRVSSPAKQPKLKAAPTTHQKQSLILLEEVDVLYEQDKQFWPTIMSLITQSKRPFVITCNEESLVPLHSLNLHGIFRFSPPPLNLAVDHMLLVAANEGHALKRAAVESLYEERNHDLRASLTDLNFWCQIGVGDQRGGIGWYYPRWPKGADRDKNGHVVRVVSEDAYAEGMGWLGRDGICNQASVGANTITAAMELEHNLLMQTWQGYGVDVGHWQDTLDMEAWAEEIDEETSRARSRRVKSLEEYEQFAERMSDADIASQGAFAVGMHVELDTTLPSLPQEVRDDFTVGRRLLEAVPTESYTELATHISTAIKSLSRNQLARISQPEIPAQESAIGAIDERNTLAHIRGKHGVKIWDAAITRLDMARAFDVIAATEVGPGSLGGGSLDASVFDRTMGLITLEVAPWVRRIVYYDVQLQEERRKMSTLLSEGGLGGGGTRGKRMRTTRSAFSAMEGGERRSTRRERYFGNGVNAVLVMKTGGSGWNEWVEVAVAEEAERGREREDVEMDED